MIKVSICICTRNRQEGLCKLLDSLEDNQIPLGYSIKIIIVENNSENFSEAVIKKRYANSRLNISYYLETNKGLSYARNRSVKESAGSDLCCFIDDDQIASSDWLSELLRCQREFDADGVWGPNPPMFNKEVPPYVKQFYEPQILKYGTIVDQAFTNCLLLRKRNLDLIEGPFDERLNFTGGEDSFLTKQIILLGGIIRYTPYAKAYELIPDNRTKVNYMFKRTYRISNARLFVNSLVDNNSVNYKVIPRLLLRFGYGLLIVIPYFLFGKVEKLKGILKIANAVGGFVFLLGRRNQFYK